MYNYGRPTQTGLQPRMYQDPPSAVKSASDSHRFPVGALKGYSKGSWDLGRVWGFGLRGMGIRIYGRSSAVDLPNN